MREAMHAAPGVGLAAPQVGFSLQLAVIEDRKEYYKEIAPEQLAERERRPVPLHVIVNSTTCTGRSRYQCGRLWCGAKDGRVL